jgi:ADP-ribose pyrophosphatase
MTISAEDYVLVDTQVVLDHPRVRMIADTLEVKGRPRPYWYLESPVEAVNILALTPDVRIVLVRQYRHPIRAVIYDLPGGRVEPGEAAIDGARRELEEETGYRAGQLELLCRYNQFPGSIKAATNLFFASDLTPTRQRLDENEELEVVLMPAADVLAMIERGEVIDGSLQLGFLLARHKGLLS